MLLGDLRLFALRLFLFGRARSTCMFSQFSNGSPTTFYLFLGPRFVVVSCLTCRLV